MEEKIEEEKKEEEDDDEISVMEQQIKLGKSPILYLPGQQTRVSAIKNYTNNSWDPEDVYAAALAFATAAHA